eukprot:806195_1
MASGFIFIFVYVTFQSTFSACIVPIRKNWWDANQYCIDNYGTTLATFQTENDAQDLAKIVQYDYWVGLSYIHVWRWVDTNEKLSTNQYWYPGEPNGYGDDCARTRCYDCIKKLLIGDLGCYYTRYFVCNSPITLQPNTSLTIAQSQDVYILNDVQSITDNATTLTYSQHVISYHYGQPLHLYYYMRNGDCYLPRITLHLYQTLSSFVVKVNDMDPEIGSSTGVNCGQPWQYYCPDYAIYLSQIDLTTLLSTDYLSYIEVYLLSNSNEPCNGTTHFMNASVDIQCTVNEHYKNNTTPHAVTYSMDIDVDAIDIQYEPQAFSMYFSSDRPGQPLSLTYRILNGICTDPEIIVFVGGDFDGTHERIAINITGDGSQHYDIVCDPNELCVQSQCTSSNLNDIHNTLNVFLLPQFNDPDYCFYQNRSVAAYGTVTLSCVSIETADTHNRTIYINTTDMNEPIADEYVSFTYQVKTHLTAQDVFIAFKVKSQPCYLPKVTMDFMNLDFESMAEYVNIYLNEHELKMNCRPSNNTQEVFNCVQRLPLSQSIYLNNQHSIHPQNDLNVFIEAHSNNAIHVEHLNDTLSLLGNITIECFNPSRSNENAIFVVNHDNLPGGMYHNYTITNTGHSPSYSSDLLFYIDPSSPCFRPLLSVDAYDSDYDGTEEYIEIKINNELYDTCDPGTNACNAWYPCIHSQTISEKVIFDLLIVELDSFGTSTTCNYNGDYISFLGNVTLSCFVHSDSPTQAPTIAPTWSPSAAPTRMTHSPSVPPSAFPSTSPTSTPTARPSNSPSLSPSKSPTDAPTIAPSNTPSFSPTKSPTRTPTLAPSHAPSVSPSVSPTDAPSLAPSNTPSSTPTEPPTRTPSLAPSNTPSATPNESPTDAPTLAPSTTPSFSPTKSPTRTPSLAPSHAPFFSPSVSPTLFPTDHPSRAPSKTPSIAPTVSPTDGPTSAPTFRPTYPSAHPSKAPTLIPSMPPTTVWYHVEADTSWFEFMYVPQECKTRTEAIEHCRQINNATLAQPKSLEIANILIHNVFDYVNASTANICNPPTLQFKKLVILVDGLYNRTANKIHWSDDTLCKPDYLSIIDTNHQKCFGYNMEHNTWSTFDCSYIPYAFVCQHMTPKQWYKIYLDVDDLQTAIVLITCGGILALIFIIALVQFL